MKKQYRFEILRRGDDRFYWLFVVLERRRRRVLARSTRDYRSAQKAKAAIAKLQRATNVVDTTVDPFPLPATHFSVVAGVLPLMVEEFPVVEPEPEPFVVLGRSRQDTPDKPTGEAVETKETAKPSASRARRPAARRGSRGSRAGKGTSAGGSEPSASR